jgi:ATP-dependent RNA helicase RhlE
LGFSDLGVAPGLAGLLHQAGIVTPTPIQALALPVAHSGRDLIGLAETGSGKTLAFALPMAARLGEGEVGLVLAPTRELAEQISATFESLGVRCALVVGGRSSSDQVRRLRARPRVIVATPGRLMDHLGSGAARLDRVRVVALDEADRMLDMGFAPAVRRILSAAPKARQTLLFSATLPPEIESLSSEFLDRPERLMASPPGKAPRLVRQEVRYVLSETKGSALDEALAEHPGPVLVFVRTRHGARKLARRLQDDGHSAAEIHADRSQSQRREALLRFKTGLRRILVATDVASRGIDVKDVALVLNYDVPEKPEDYVHRIGRTGRAGAAGTALMLALPEQRKDVRDIERLMGEEIAVSASSAPLPQERGRFPKGPCPQSGQGRPSPAAPVSERGALGPRTDRPGGPRRRKR